ncbi:lytic transglycosylase domain-containing protein [Streptomyces sp. MAG02]|nr:lytic transglycosylase domain-containing protein [Streptomyces sp. MAG02]
MRLPLVNGVIADPLATRLQLFESPEPHGPPTGHTHRVPSPRRSLNLRRSATPLSPKLGFALSFAARISARKKSIAAAGATLLAASGIAMAAVPAQAAPTSAQAIAQQMMPSDQFQCFSKIVTHESGWNPSATNSSSGAYGLVQALPGSKMASAGADWKSNPATQIKWGLNYMNDRYGSPCGAWNFWQQNSWY